MRNVAFQPCIPTRGIKVPVGPDWIHEIKHDGYRLIVERDGARVRTFTRNGHDWSDRFPLIVEAALENKQQRFVIDGEAVLLGDDGVSDFNGLHSRRHNDQIKLYAFDILALDGDDLRTLPLHLRKEKLARLLAKHRDWAEGLVAARAALRLNLADLEARRTAVRCLYSLGQSEGARRELQTLFGFHPPDEQRLRSQYAALRP